VGIISDAPAKCKLTADNRRFLIQSSQIIFASELCMSEIDNFRQRVFHIIAAIPLGQVTTYGAVARMAGSPRAARQVGGVLKKLPPGSTLPWHRVVNRHGEISLQGEDFKRQRQALLAEGIIFAQGKIDLLKYGWQG
jgi:methylated-DNA-protein-cysteine methyltransferase-like protein